MRVGGVGGHIPSNARPKKELLNSDQESRVRGKVENLKLWVIVEPIMDHSSQVETYVVPYHNKPGEHWHIPLVIGNEDAMQAVKEYDNMSCVTWAKTGMVVQDI